MDFRMVRNLFRKIRQRQAKRERAAGRILIIPTGDQKIAEALRKDEI